MITKPLTPAQRAILTRAIKDSNGRLDWFPETVKGGARLFALNGLANRTLIAKSGTDWLVTPAGYRVFEMLELDTSQAAALASGAEPFRAITRKPQRMREDTKLAHIVELMRRPGGATMQEMCEATGWQPNTVIATVCGPLKKQHGFKIISVRRYSIESECTEQADQST
ncbi:DUF3489 domain-containing protein [Ralstonia solanacearum]|uniref:DUF3489 domain-containing protein n=1 Tax=Ralstonia solanacearum TaxID=305 RepID=UPI0001D94BEE|nr:DUF3489 domain-containing protein [Ralstonia solanacearum]CBJ49611.1 conserved hypothethical protein [Ralstonia solanacearum PSI07]